MLEQLRKGTGSWIAKIFIGLLVLSFAVWGISDIFTGRQGTTLAEVGTQKISAESFQQAFQRELQALSQRLGRQLSPDQARALGLDTQVLARLVSEAAIDDQVQRLGLAISNDAMAGEILKNPVFRGADGKFDRQRFEQLLSSNGFTEEAFVGLERQNRLRGQVAGIVTGKIDVPDTLTRAIYRQQNEKRTADYFRLTAENVRDVGTPDDAQLKAYYEANKSRFTAPEYRKATLLKLEPLDIGKSVKISQEQLQKAYDDRASEYVTPETREVEQIVFPTLEEAAAAREKIIKGTDFAEIAKARGFTPQDISLGKVTRKEIPDPVIADAVFDLKEGDISVPISGSLSIVLLRVKSIEPETKRSLEDVRKELEQKIAGEKAQEEVLNVHDAVEDERAGGATFAEIAKRLNLPLIEIDAVDRKGLDQDGNKIENIPDLQKVLSLIFDTDVGVEVDPVDTTTEGFVWVDVTGITPSKVKAFEKVTAEAIEAWKQERRRALLSDKAKELVKRLEAGEALQAVAQGVGSKVERSRPLRRRDTDATITAQAIDAMFAVPRDTYAINVADDGGSALLMHVADVAVPEYSADATDVKSLDGHLQRGLGDDLLQQYLTGLRARTGVQINDAVWRVLKGETS